jgi:hypothetical protein
LAKTLAESVPDAGLFSRLQIAELSDSGLIDALVASERLMRFAQGLQVRVLAVLAHQRSRHRGLEAGAVEAEVTAALRWSPSVVQYRLDTAGTLAKRFPETLELLATAQIGSTQAEALAETTAALSHNAARAVQARVLSRMPTQSNAATRKALRRAVLAVDPAGAEKRHERQLARRRVALRPEDDGMATLEWYTTAQNGAAVMSVLNRHARKGIPGDPRTVDQRRADAFADLVFAGAGVHFNRTQSPETSEPIDQLPALVQVVVGIETLMGLNEEPAELKGYGPINALQARALAFAPGSVWRRLLTSPDGSLLRVDPTTYRPTASVARLVRERDRTCVFPGCAMPSARCDLDHIEAFDYKNPQAGGKTEPANLHALCRRHHRLKTSGVWTPVRAEDGATRWTGARGRSYMVTPRSYLAS